MSDSEEAIWDPISSLGRVMPPSDFVLDSSRSSFSQTKKNWPERLLPRPSPPHTLTHVKFNFLRTSPLTCKKKHHRVSFVVKVTVDRSSSRCGMHATKTLGTWTQQKLKLKFQRGSPGSIFAGGGHFELPHARALPAAELKGPDKVQATVGASSA